MATAPTFTPAEVAAGQQFFSSSPTPEQIYGRASEIGLSPEQVAGLYQQSMGGDLSGLLGGVNQYLSATGQSLAGGYQSGLLNGAGNVTDTLDTTNQNVRVIEPFSWSPTEISEATNFFASNPSADQMFAKADELGLSPQQFASLYQTATGADYDTALDTVLSYLKNANKTLKGGYIPGTAQPPTVDNIVNQISGGLPKTLGTVNPTLESSAYDTSNYFDRYFPVSVTGGRANQTTGLSNVSGQSSLADILANIQGQYTPQQFTRSGGSYGAGRFLPADMAPASINKPGSTGFTPSEISKATEYFGQVTDPQQIFNRANEIGLSGTQLADLFSKSTGANYNDVLQSINNWTEATGQTLKGGYTPGSASWFEPASFDQYTQNLVNQSLDEAVAETMGAGGAGGSGGEQQGTPSAWSKMTESERQSWVSANPGKYIAGLTAASAFLPGAGGVYLAARQDPYLGMSLAEYAAGKAGNIAMGGLLPVGQGAPIYVAGSRARDMGLSLQEMAGLTANAQTFGVDSNKDYFGD